MNSTWIDITSNYVQTVYAFSTGAFVDNKVAMYVKELRVSLDAGANLVSLNEIEIFTDDVTYQERLVL